MDLGSQVRALARSARSSFLRSVLEKKDGVKVEGKYTVSINLDNPNPLLAKLQPNLYNPIYNSTKCKQESNTDDPWARKFLENNSAGFGPYRLDQLQRGQQAVFKAREDYYRGKPAMDTVVFREVPTSATRASLLQGGAVDIAQYLQPLEIIKLRGEKGVAVDSVDASFMIWLELNAQIEPFGNREGPAGHELRLPARAGIEDGISGHRITAQRLHAQHLRRVSPIKFWKYKYDPEMAKALLKEAGMSSGFKTSLAYNAGDPVQEPIAILYQTALRDIGVELELKKIPPATFYNAVSERKQPIIFYVDSPWCPDVGYSMTLYFNSKSFINYSNYKNDDVDALIRDTARTNDQAKRLEMMTNGTGDGHVRGALGLHRLSGLPFRPARQSQGLYLLHLEQHPVPGFQPGGMSNTAISGPAIPAVPGSGQGWRRTVPAVAIFFRRPARASELCRRLRDCDDRRRYRAARALAGALRTDDMPIRACTSCRRAAAMCWAPTEPAWTSSAACCSRRASILPSPSSAPCSPPQLAAPSVRWSAITRASVHGAVP